jgi:hypothetical protein
MRNLVSWNLFLWKTQLQLAMCALLALTTAGDHAFAWGHEGHEVTGSVADQLLRPNAKAKVAQILGFELRIAGPWLDCVRSVKQREDGTFKYAPDPEHPEYRVPCTSFETSDEIARMEDYVGRNWSNCTFKPGHGCDETYHFADVPVQRDRYDRTYAGTSEHDIVSAINAAILVLSDRPAPQPFSIRDKKEALFLLAHLLGDLHQPLHVGAVYLTRQGALVDPPSNNAIDPKTETEGGNLIKDQHTNLHHEWDAIPSHLGRAADAAMMQKASAIPPTPGEIKDLATIWASETVMLSHAAFAGLTFAGEGSEHWSVQYANRDDYWKAQDKVKVDQIAKGGARLAQLLNAIWP